MKKTVLACFVFLSFFVASASAQDRALTFQEAEKQGIAYLHLDSLYKSAVNADVNLAVFKTPEEQAKLQQAYVKLLQDLGTFLNEHQFTGENPTRCFNRIYFTPDGRIDYFLFNFPADQITPEKEKKFSQLLNLFIQDYQFAITAGEKFAQCSPVKYTDN